VSAPRFHRVESDDGSEVLVLFFCPGCRNEHPFTVKTNIPGRPVWEWNGDLVHGTFAPSLLCNSQHPPSRCHSFVRNGRIEFLGDCHHELKGQTVDVPEWED
jgi:hypothetical protein